MMTLRDQLRSLRLMPVLALPEQAIDCDALAKALIGAQLPAVEVTFRSASAPACLQSLQERGDLLVGAGTVIDRSSADTAKRHGAAFAVSPGFTPSLAQHCHEIGLPLIPGVCTPSELLQAREMGIGLVKFFPAGNYGGAATLHSLSSVFGDVEFMPTGGISIDNLADYLRLPAVVACGASWLVDKSLLAKGDYTEIERRCREAVELSASIDS